MSVTVCSICMRSDCVQGKHQPLQYLNISTLREYLRFEFSDLVGEAVEPVASNPAMSNPWQQVKDQTEPAASDVNKEATAEDCHDADASPIKEADEDLASDSEENNDPNTISEEPNPMHSTSNSPAGGMKGNGRFNFENVLQDFVLLTFLVGFIRMLCIITPHIVMVVSSSVEVLALASRFAFALSKLRLVSNGIRYYVGSKFDIESAFSCLAVAAC